MAALVFRLCDNAPEMLRDVCLEKGWQEFGEKEDELEGSWNLWWKTSGFRTCDYEDCRPWQRLNHFPKTSAITRKDCLARNLRRMRGVYGNSLFNFVPLSFNLPNDYRKFVSEYSKQKDGSQNYWICKPVDLSRGRGIFLFRNLIDLTYDCATVAQKYISNPLLISGYKFDLRLYALVTSFQPLCIYLYQEGLVRFGTEKFDLSCLDNLFSHLTNTSINKQGPSYSMDKERVGVGCKWSLSQLRTYFNQHNVDDRLLWHRINCIIILTLLTQAPEVTRTSNCFELFGFDILVDANLKPWLLEVNFSPALGTDCVIDVTIKKPLLTDTLEALNFNPDDFCTPKPVKIGTSNCSTRRDKARSKSRLASSRSLNITSSHIPLQPLKLLKSKARFQLNTQSEVEIEDPVRSKAYCRENSKGSESSNSIDLNNNNASSYSSMDSERNSVEDSDLSANQNTSVSTQQDSSSSLSDFATRPQSSLSMASCFTTTAASEEFLQAATHTSNGSNTEKGNYSGSESQQRKGSTSSYSTNHQNQAACMNAVQKTPQQVDNVSEETGTSDVKRKSSMAMVQSSQAKLFPRRNTIAQLQPGQFPHRSPSLPPLRRSLDRAYTSDRALPRSSSSLSKRQSTGSMPDVSIIHKSKSYAGYIYSGRQTRKTASSLKYFPKIGDYYLVFPFNEATKKAASLQPINTRAVVEEVKKALQTVTTEVHSCPQAKATPKEHMLDLTQPIWGFRPVFEYPNNS